MLIADKTPALVAAVEAARHFLNLDDRDRFASDWCQRLVTAKEARPFFRGSALKTSKGFAARVGFEVALAYIECAENDDYLVAPTMAEINAAKDCALGLERKIAKSPWMKAEATSASFQTTLKMLGNSPSRLPPRGPGRPALVHRQRFVKIAAENLYYLSSQFHIGLLTVAASLGWEDIYEKQVRLILTTEIRQSIAETVNTTRLMSRLSDDAAGHVISRARSITRGVPVTPADPRTDGERLRDAISHIRGVSNAWASADLIQRLLAGADDHGIEMPDPVDGQNTP